MADMGHLLQEQLESLRKLLETFVKPTPQGTTAIESGTATLHGKPTPLIGPQEKAFVLRLSGHLDVDAVCCFELLRDTVRYELQHPSVSPSFYGQGGKGLTYGDELLEAVTGYYLADREALLLLVESIIKAAQDPQHMHHDPCQEILSTLLQKHSLEQTLHTQLKAALAAPVPKRFQGNPKYAALWATHLLKEQRGLLQILIMLYYEQVSCTGSSVATLMETLAASRFGNDQMNGSYFDESAEPLLGQISHQVLVLCTEMLNLEELLGGDAIESLGELPGGTLLQSPALLESVNALFWKGLYRPVDSRPAYRNSGPLAILWATFTQRVVSLLEVSCPPGYEDIFKKWSEPNAQGQFVPQLLLQNAFTDLGGFQGLLKDLESHIYESSFGSYLLAYGSILKGFLSLFVVTQNVSTLPNRHILVSCFARLFASSEDLAVQFWEQDYPLPERRSLLDTTRRAFPIEFHPFIELLKALSSGTKSAQYTLRYMEQLPTCTTLFDETHYILPGLSRSQTKAFWKAGHLVHGSSSLLISPPRGATGHFVARDIILLEFPYSGIHLLLSLIDSFLSAHAYDSSFMDEQIICVSGTKETVSDALLFLGSLLEKMDAQAIHRLMAHLSKLRGVPKDSVPEFVVGLLTKILDRCANFPTPAFTLISYTLKVMSSLLRVYPNIVWRHLRARNFLPKYTLSAFSQGTYASSSSYVQSTLLPAERTQGRYQITLMFLKLVHDLVADAQLLRQPGR